MKKNIMIGVRLRQISFWLIIFPIAIGINLCNLCFAQEEEISEQKEKTKPHFDFGGNIYFGYSRINNSGSIDNYYNRILSENDTISKKDFTSRFGTIYGISALISFVVSDRIHLNAGLRYQAQQNNIELQEKNLTIQFPNQGNSYNKISSTASISVSSLTIPITAKIRFLTGEDNPFKGEIHPYIRTGISFDTRLTKKLDFEETHLEYRESTPDTTYKLSFSNVKLDGYGTSAVNFIIGAGLDFVLFEHDKTTFFMDLTLSSNFNNEPLWISDLSSKGKDNTTNGEIFDKETAEKNYIDDWKSSHVGITIGLLF